MGTGSREENASNEKTRASVPIQSERKRLLERDPEKQAMLEAPDLKTRAEILVAVTEMDLAKKRTSNDTGLQ